MLRKAPLILTIIGLWVSHNLRAQGCLLYPVTLNERVNNSALVIEGKVVNKESYWNDQHTQILTSCFIEVHKVFKGEQVPQMISFVIPGGQVGMNILKVNPEIKVKTGDYGIFMLSTLSDDYRNQMMETNHPGVDFYKAYAWSQSFIPIYEGKVHDIFYNYKGNEPGLLYEKIIGITGIPFTNYQETPNEYLMPLQISQVKAITGFSPATVTAGTLGALSVLTINGSGFGAVQGAGVVRFRNADDGGATFITVGADLASDYISWNDVQIVVRVPSGCGTGTFQVTNNGGTTFTSATPVTISYNHIDIIANPGSGFQRYEPDLVALNGAAAGDYTLTYNTAFAGNAPAVTAFQDALANWVFKTGVSFVVGAGTSAVNSNINDAINIVTFNGGLGPGVLGVSFSNYSGCITGGQIYWRVADIDLLFATVPGGSTWYFGCDGGSIGFPQFDFESVAVHELGHHHQLSHIINTGGVMHFSIANGQVKRLIAANDEAGGDYVVAHSIIANACGPGPMTTISGPPPGCAPLPVELLGFDATLNANDDVELTWSTAAEINNDHFIIERTTNMVDFEEIGIMHAAGNSAMIQNYEITDKNPVQGISYYRLKQVDYDGAITDYGLRSIYIGNPTTDQIMIFPNLSNTFIQVQLPDQQIYEIRIIDSFGKIISLAQQPSQISLDVSMLTSGCYFIQASGITGKTFHGKFMVIH